MKHLGLVHIILMIGVGALLSGTAGGYGGLTAYQSLPPSAEVGQMVMVTVYLTYNGFNSTQATVTPNLPMGVVANGGGQIRVLNPGITEQVSYSLMAQQSGSYWIASDISYDEDGAWRSLRLEDPFTVMDSGPSVPQGSEPFPGGQESGEGFDPFAPSPGGDLPNGENPPHEGEGNATGEPPGGF